MELKSRVRKWCGKLRRAVYLKNEEKIKWEGQNEEWESGVKKIEWENRIRKWREVESMCYKKPKKRFETPIFFIFFILML